MEIICDIVRNIVGKKKKDAKRRLHGVFQDLRRQGRENTETLT